MRAISSPSLIVSDMSSNNVEVLSCKAAVKKEYEEKENQQTKSKETMTTIKYKRGGCPSINASATTTTDLYSKDNNSNKCSEQKMSTSIATIELPCVEDKNPIAAAERNTVSEDSAVTANTESSCVKYRFGPLIWRSSKERRKTKFNRSDKCNSGDSGIQIELDGDENCTRILSMNNTINSLTSNNLNKCIPTKDKTNTVSTLPSALFRYRSLN